jgi:hypothetical protein
MLGTPGAAQSCWRTKRRRGRRRGSVVREGRLMFVAGLVMMLVVLSTNIPRYFVESYVDQSALGIFGAIGYLSVAGTMAANKSGLQMSTVRNLLMAWVLTLPCAILLSGSLFWLFSHVF